MPATVTAAREVVEALKAAGVLTYFGIPGGPVSPLFEALFTVVGVSLVESRHESSAAFSAMGYFRSTGLVPAVLVTAGPGITNAVTGVAAAHAERVPLVVICGDVSWAATGGRLAQDSGPEGLAVELMLRSVTRRSIRVARAESAGSQALAVLRAATNGDRPGPALLVVPMNLSRTQVTPAVYRLESSRTETPAPPSLVAEAATLLAGANRPLILLGDGARRDAEGMAQLISAIDVPFMTTPQAKGIISEEHPLSLRQGGLGASQWARGYCARGVDVALVLGADLDDSSIAGTPPVSASGTLIHVDLDTTVFHRNHRAAVAIAADLGDFGRALLGHVTDAPDRRIRGADLMREARDRSPYETPDFAYDARIPIAPHRAIADLQRAAGPNAQFVSDIGEHMLFALHYLTARSPTAFTIHLGLGSMASGIGSAIGLAIGNPRVRVVCVCGDGGMQMGGMEAVVAVARTLPVLFAVFNDSRYNMVYHGYRQIYGADVAWETPPIDFVGWAQSIGMTAIRIDGPGQISASLLDHLLSKGPALLDIRIDRDVRLRGGGRNESLAAMAPSRAEALL
jgi:acetolactate synthase-1/2/3 large subunit